MGWFVGAVKGVGQVAAAVDDGERLTASANERTAGVNLERASENAASAKVNENVAKAAVGSTDASALEQLRQGGA